MNGSVSGGGKVFGRFSEPAHRVLDLAREAAERAGHRYLGPEHILLGLLAEDHSRACGPPLVAKQALQLASRQAHAPRHGEVRPEHLLLGVLEDTWQPTDKPKSSRRLRQIIAHVGLPDSYHGAAGPLLAGLEIDLGRLQAAVAAKLRGIQR